MATITIKNVPTEIVNEVGATIQYSNDFQFLGKRRLVNSVKNSIEYWDDVEINNLGKSCLVTSNSF